LKNKKVLMMGLGILGGGVATARFLVGKGAELTVTDLKSEDYLKTSLDLLKDISSQIKFVLGEHREEDFLNNEIIVINPDVPADNKFVKLARENGKQIENELTLFYKFSPCQTVVGITGTRGKTTTTNWINHILNSAGRKARVLGNDPKKPLLSEINECDAETIAVIEQPSFLLEIMDISAVSPHVAVVTNIFQDHLSRHKTMKGYALAKANIFKKQKAGDFLILDPEDEWTQFFLNLSPKAKVVYPSVDALSGFDGASFAKEYGRHSLKNFLLSAHACLVLGVSVEDIIKSAETLPQIKWRQEIVFENERLQIYNDTAACSPEATMVALERFSGKDRKLILISGGTDRELDFREWGVMVKKYLEPENIILLSGTATEKMKKELGSKVEEHDILEECFKSALEKAKGNNAIILFSPSSKSFEKFNKLVEEAF